ncbi:MAG: DUF2892 domain-containing protein [Actinomycetota bacterium]|nr:DUF2892 domain-containing protein [Actinomycetota bacterium]
MSRNVGVVDRALRAILGILVIGYVALSYATLASFWMVILGIVGLFLLITGVVGFCPLYALLKIDSLAFKFHRHKIA